MIGDERRSFTPIPSAGACRRVHVDVAHTSPDSVTVGQTDATPADVAALLTPVATPVNLMVMGPGGYRFGDYWKLRVPGAGVLAVLRRVSPRRGR